MLKVPKIGKATVPPDTRCEIVRSFSYKLNAGQYESRDFFCSQKCECNIEDASDISERLYEFVKGQVMKAVNEYKRDNAAALQMRKAG
jgi:hypothetical protein